MLPGGNVAGGVVRIGTTVRKPVTAATPAVEALLAHFASVGFTGAPRTLGRDSQGRQVLEYIPGEILHGQSPLGSNALTEVATLIREFHDAVEGFAPPDGAHWDVVIPPDRTDIVGHNDLAPWNLVRGPRGWVFIDWDGAGPASRLWDLGYAAHGFVPLHADGDSVVDGHRLRTFADGYGLDEQQRREFPERIAAHVRGMFDLLLESSLTGRQPWARLYAEGHGGHWGPAADYIDQHLREWTDVLLS
jgi:Phosphotransferase enzyme family